MYTWFKTKYVTPTHYIFRYASDEWYVSFKALTWDYIIEGWGGDVSYFKSSSICQTGEVLSSILPLQLSNIYLLAQLGIWLYLLQNLIYFLLFINLYMESLNHGILRRYYKIWHLAMFVYIYIVCNDTLNGDKCYELFCSFGEESSVKSCLLPMPMKLVSDDEKSCSSLSFLMNIINFSCFW